MDGVLSKLRRRDGDSDLPSEKTVSETAQQELTDIIEDGEDLHGRAILGLVLRHEISRMATHLAGPGYGPISEFYFYSDVLAESGYQRDLLLLAERSGEPTFRTLWRASSIRGHVMHSITPDGAEGPRNTWPAVQYLCDTLDALEGRTGEHLAE